MSLLLSQGFLRLNNCKSLGPLESIVQQTGMMELGPSLAFYVRNLKSATSLLWKRVSSQSLPKISHNILYHILQMLRLVQIVNIKPVLIMNWIFLRVRNVNMSGWSLLEKKGEEQQVTYWKTSRNCKLVLLKKKESDDRNMSKEQVQRS